MPELAEGHTIARVGSASADQNARTRTVGLSFVVGGDIDKLPMIRITMEPLRNLLHGMFEMRSSVWEAQQQQQHIIADAEPHSRKFRLVQAAIGDMERACSDAKFKLLDSPASWLPVHPSQRTVETNVEALCLLTRSLAIVEELVAAENQRFPIRMFKLLANTACREELSSTPECMLDAWSKAFIHEHRADLGSEEALAKLDSLASIVPLDVASVEAAHGRVRRRLFSSSHSTDLQEMPQCNAEWVCAEARRRTLDLSRHSGTQTYTSKPRVRVQQKPKASRRGRAKGGKAHKAKGGGQCRAFMSLGVNSGKKFAQLHREYAGLSAVEKESMGLRELGASMTKAAL
jgi:hypothetical protein